ncbi:DUF3164 family protein [Flavobacterium sp. TN-1]
MEVLAQLSDDEILNELARRNEKKEANKKAFNDLKEEHIPQLFNRLKQWSEDGEVIKAEIYQGLKQLIELKFETYSTKTNQKSHTFSASNGQTITIGYHVTASYDDTVFMGVAKVKNFINSLIKDEDTAKLVKQINNLLKPDKKGDLDPKRVMELKQITKEYKNFELLEGVEIIENAYSPRRSAWFIQASFQNNVGIDQHLPLSISSMNFPKGFDLSFLIKDENQE